MSVLLFYSLFALLRSSFAVRSPSSYNNSCQFWTIIFVFLGLYPGSFFAYACVLFSMFISSDFSISSFNLMFVHFNLMSMFNFFLGERYHIDSIFLLHVSVWFLKHHLLNRMGVSSDNFVKNLASIAMRAHFCVQFTSHGLYVRAYDSIMLLLSWWLCTVVWSHMFR